MIVAGVLNSTLKGCTEMTFILSHMINYSLFIYLLSDVKNIVSDLTINK